VNHYSFEEIAVGQTESFSASIDTEKMALFSRISGDENPLHTDAGFAAAQGFPDRVVFGMLTASFLSTLAGMYLPGERSLIHEVSVQFPNALLLPAGQEISVRGTVADKNERFRRLTLKVQITDAEGRKVLRGAMKVGVRE
jgi:acyl dehydratase